MALTKVEKEQIVAELTNLLKSSKLTVVANYKGTSVKELQDLRKQAQEGGTKVKVIKNRLVIKAIQVDETLKSVDVSQLNQQLLYAFNDQDEVAPAQALAKFAKTAPTLQFVGAITADGQFMSPEDVKSLASLPGKNQIIAEVIATLNSPVNDVLSGLSGGLDGILSGLEAKAAN